MSDISNFKTGQYFVSSADPETGVITFTQTPPPERQVTMSKKTFLSAYEMAQAIDEIPLPSGTPRLYLLLKCLGFDD